MNNFKKQVDFFDSKYTPSEFTKREFSFTQQEERELQKWEAVRQNAMTVSDAIVTGECLTRVGTKATVDTHAVYSVADGKFVVWVPKFWCSMCDKRKASVTYKEKPFCEECIQVIKMQAAIAQAEEKPKVEPKKKPS
jgi:hypothetical protein